MSHLHIFIELIPRTPVTTSGRVLCSIAFYSFAFPDPLHSVEYPTLRLSCCRRMAHILLYSFFYCPRSSPFFPHILAPIFNTSWVASHSSVSVVTIYADISMVKGWVNQSVFFHKRAIRCNGWPSQHKSLEDVAMQSVIGYWKQFNSSFDQLIENNKK